MNNIEKQLSDQIKELRKEEESLIHMIREKENYLHAQQNILRLCKNSHDIDETIEILNKKRDQLCKIYLQ
jgi:intein-encoded DNA endonuclease-like protein